MTETSLDHRLPGDAVPYVVRAGQGLRHLAGGHIVHTLAGIRETAGGLGVIRASAPRMNFFGIVAPGGWEEFFADAGEVWGMTGLPPADRPFDFARMGPAMAKHGIMRVNDPVYADVTPMTEADQRLPDGPVVLLPGSGARAAAHAFWPPVHRDDDGPGKVPALPICARSKEGMAPSCHPCAMGKPPSSCTCCTARSPCG